jgi:hypothetical protein
MGVVVEPGFGVVRRCLERLFERDFSSLVSYDRVVNIEDEVYSESLDLVESRSLSGVTYDIELEITWPWVKEGRNAENRIPSLPVRVIQG